MNASDVEKNLKKIVDYYGKQVDSYLNAGNYPAGQDPFRKDYKPIESTKKIGSPVTSGDETSLKIAYGSQKEAPYAVAYEFGSGEHAYVNPEKYEIRPKKSIRFRKYFRSRGKRSMVMSEPALAVGAWQVRKGMSGWKPASLKALYGSPKYAGKIGRGIYALRYVEHPGVAARPFAEPVWLLEQNTILGMMGQGLFAVVQDELRKI